MTVSSRKPALSGRRLLMAYLPPAITILIGLVLSLVILKMMQGMEGLEIRIAFNRASEDRISRLKRGISSSYPVIEYMAAPKGRQFRALSSLPLIGAGILAIYLIVGRRSRDRISSAYEDLQVQVRDRKEAERALRESEKRYRDLVENALVGVYKTNLDGDILYANRALAKLFDFKRPCEIMKEGIVMRYRSPEDRRHLIDNLREHGSVTGYEVEALTKGGAPKTVLLSATLYGEAVSGMIMDISERKQAEEDREAFIAELEAKNTELERFAYTVSHDLKSPLITIQGFLDLLERDAASGDSGKVKSDIQRISRAADQMKLLLDELLELSRVGRLVNPPEAFSFRDLAEEAVWALSERIEARGVRVHISPGLPTVFGDRRRLADVMQNLLENAIKWMGEEPAPQIHIDVRKDGPERVFYVRDNGMGIDPRYHERVFGLFERLDPDVEGTGVGLAVAKRIVILHGGRIWVESEGGGKGSTFCFTLSETGERASPGVG